VNVAQQFYITGRSAVEIGASIESGIRDGHLAPAGRLPTVRELAARLHVSPTTVAAVYRDLGARGLLTAAGRRGTAVCPRPPVACGWRAMFGPGIRDLASGNPDPMLLPDLGRALADIEVPTRLYGERADDPDLIDLAGHWLRRDGIAAAHLCVVSGAIDGLERVLAAHLRPGARVGVEDPGYPGILDLLTALGLVPQPLAIDDSGLLPDDLAEALPGLGALVLTPRAQNPFGARLDAERAAALRTVLAGRPDLLVVEDDHAGEIAGAAAHSLCGNRTRWGVIRSLSKAFGPDLRLAILSGDATTVARVEGRRLLGPGWVSHILQRLVVRLWTDPATPALLESAARTYARRREALLAALRQHGIPAHGSSGINVWVPVANETGTVAALLDAGWGVLAGERFRMRCPRGIRVSTARLLPEDAQRFAADLAAALMTAPSRVA